MAWKGDKGFLWYSLEFSGWWKFFWDCASIHEQFREATNGSGEGGTHQRGNPDAGGQGGNYSGRWRCHNPCCMPAQSAESPSGQEVREIGSKYANQNTSSLMSQCVLQPFFLSYFFPFQCCFDADWWEYWPRQAKKSEETKSWKWIETHCAKAVVAIVLEP